MKNKRMKNRILFVSISAILCIVMSSCYVTYYAYLPLSNKYFYELGFLFVADSVSVKGNVRKTEIIQNKNTNCSIDIEINMRLNNLSSNDIVVDKKSIGLYKILNNDTIPLILDSIFVIVSKHKEQDITITSNLKLPDNNKSLWGHRLLLTVNVDGLLSEREVFAYKKLKMPYR
jgi:hypothetical protein